MILVRPKFVLLDRDGHVAFVASDRYTLDHKIHVRPFSQGRSHAHHQLDAPADFQRSLGLEENSFAADVECAA